MEKIICKKIEVDLCENCCEVIAVAEKEVGSFNCGNGDFVKVEFFVKETETDKCSVYYNLKFMDFTEDNVLTTLFEFVNKTFKEGGIAYGV